MGDDKRPHEIESRYSCFRCGHCMAICPKSAIRLREFPDFVPEESVPSITADELQALFRHRRSCRWFDRKCTKDEIESLISSAMYAPTAENSQSVEFVVIDDEFDDFMRLCASILKDHVDEHPRLKQFVEYVESGSEGKNNPFTWEGRQLIISFARFPIDAVISMEQIDLMATTMGLGGFHSRWILQASENDPETFMSFFPEISQGLQAFAVFIIGHPRLKYRRSVPRYQRRTILR